MTESKTKNSIKWVFGAAYTKSRSNETERKEISLEAQQKDEKRKNKSAFASLILVQRRTV